MSQGQRDWPKLMLRLPPDAKGWIEEQARRHATSQNSEIVRSVRERMERTQPATGTSFPAHPAAGSDDTACQGGPATHG